MDLDTQTRVFGIGAAALFVLAAIMYDAIGEPWNRVVLIVLAAIALWGFWPLLDGLFSLKSRPPIALAGMILFGVASLGCAVWYFGPRTTVVAERNAGTIFIQCSNALLPSMIPQTGTFYGAQLIPGTSGQAGQDQQLYGDPGALLDWQSRGFGDRAAYKCELRNDGATPLVGVSVLFRVKFKEFVKDNGAGSIVAHAGKILASGYLNVTADRIDPGKENAFVVFLYNASPHYAEAVPESASASSELGKEQKIALLSAPNGLPMQFSPAHNQITSTTSTKLYSKQDRENLADMTSELIAFLRDNGGDGGGNGAWKKLAMLGNEWNAKGGSPGNISFLVTNAASAKNAVTALWDGLYGEHGIYQKYPAYHNEFEQFFPPQEQYPTQIHELQGALADFDTAVNAVISETDPESRKNIQMALRPSSEKYSNTIQQFQRHLFEATQRIEKFRRSLSTGGTTDALPQNSMGNVNGNKGIVTQGQTGDNSK